MNTKMAIREKLQSVEERVGILNLASSQKKIQQEQLLEGEKVKNSAVNSFILSRIASTISSISSKAYQSTSTSASIIELEDTQQPQPIITMHIEETGDPIMRFKKLGQYMIDMTVTCAILIKQSPLPGIFKRKKKHANSRN
jgi:hypothetical protein